MANKNSLRIKTLLAKARKAGNHELAIEVPTSHYHNDPKGKFIVRRIPILAKSIYKAKKQNFPKVGESLSLIEQRKMLSY